MSFLSSINKYLSNFFITQDPKAQAFDLFYRELLQSELYKKTAKQLQGHPGNAYNLLTKENYQFIKDWLQSKDAHSIFEFGCGLSPMSSLLKEFPHILIIGHDFSKSAITQAKIDHPNQHFEVFHHHLKYQVLYDSVVCLDSLYDSSARPKAMDYYLKRLVKKSTKRLLLIQNFNASVTPPLLKGMQQTIVDVTPAFKQLVGTWEKTLTTLEVQQDTKKYPVLWGTIAREFHHHRKSLERGQVKRLVVTYEKS
jgi:hypothetical protein